MDLKFKVSSRKCIRFALRDDFNIEIISTKNINFVPDWVHCQRAINFWIIFWNLSCVNWTGITK